MITLMIELSGGCICYVHRYLGWFLYEQSVYPVSLTGKSFLAPDSGLLSQQLAQPFQISGNTQHKTVLWGQLGGQGL